MTPPRPLMLSIVAASLEIAVKSGSIIRQIYSTGNLQTLTKGPKDFQTEADRKSQQCIVSSFKSLFPDIKIIAEEENLDDLSINENTITKLSLLSPVYNIECPASLKEVKADDITIWVDPLDGTLELTHGIYDAVTVLIGISVNGVPQAGIIHKPFNNYSKEMHANGDSTILRDPAFNSNPEETLGDCIWSIVGTGKVFGLTQLPAPASTAPETPFRNFITTTRARDSHNYTRAISLISPEQVLKYGGAGNKVLKVLTKEVDAYINPCPGTKRWDTCAGEALLASLNGRLTSRLGKNYSYSHDCDPLNESGIIATLKNHDFYVDKLKDF